MRQEVDGPPGESRTPDLLVRSQTLYPAELRARGLELIQFKMLVSAFATGNCARRPSQIRGGALGRCVATNRARDHESQEAIC